MKLFAACYAHFQNRRGWLLLSLFMLLGFAGWYLPQMKVEESISAMLPDGGSEVSRDFRFLQRAPFARKLVIHLTADAGIDSGELLAATDRLQAELPQELFHNKLSGPGEMASNPLFRQLGDSLPYLLDNDDLQQLAIRLNPQQIDAQMASALAQLLQPQGVALKRQIQRDPLQLESLALQKLRYLNPIPGVRLERGHFISRDGRSSLILADTPIAITDTIGARKLLEAFDKVQRQLPDGIEAELISGHSYTLANAEVIQGDMQRVLLVSGVGILLIFLLFLRSLRALSVYLLPLFSMLAAVLISTIWFGTLSGITLGFGAVLLGITIDFGLHVYFALCYGGGLAERRQLLQAVSRPVMFGGMTTLAALSVLLFSDLPGQRQLAVFAIAGIIAALLLALLFLPHFIGQRKNVNAALGHRHLHRNPFDRSPRLRVAVLLLWLVVAGSAAWQAQDLSINGELRQLSYLPAKLQQAEKQLSEKWGNMRGRALIFVEAVDLETALQRNEKIWQKLKQQGLQDDSISLATLLPSQRTQQQRLQAWENFWQLHRATSFDLFQTSAQKYGFSTAAFDPFWARLDQTAANINRPLLESWGLGRMLDNLLLTDDFGYQLLTLVPDQTEVIQSLEADLATVPGVTLVSQSRFGRQLSSEIGSDFKRTIGSAGIAVLVLLLLLFRRLQNVLLALLPVLTGLLVMFGGMGWLGLEINLFNVVASILIIGLGVDYGIFMVCHGQQEKDLASSRAVLISGLTTLVGFGALVLAKHPALHSIGLTVLFGISAAVPTAILVIPALQPRRL